jgi:hypothetical protein
MPRTRHRRGPVRSAAPAGETPTLMDVERRWKLARAEQAELDVRRRRGQLIERDQVVSAVFELGRQYRDAWLNWPTRVAATLAAGWHVDGAQVHRDLEDAVHAQLSALADLTFPARAAR